MVVAGPTDGVVFANVWCRRRVMHTDPKSSVDILEHVTQGGVHVETLRLREGERRSFEPTIAVDEPETGPYGHAADTPSLRGRRDGR